jgi:hypothetical protein
MCAGQKSDPPEIGFVLVAERFLYRLTNLIKNPEGAKIMGQWIPFAEGEYWVERAYLMTSVGTATPLEEATLEIYTGRDGIRRMRGSAKVKNLMVVKLLEDDDDLHLLIDLGEEFKYLMEYPQLQAGKVFSPHIKAVVKFSPNKQWKQMSKEEFEQKIDGLQFIEE